MLADVQTDKNITSNTVPVEPKTYRDAMSHYAGAVQVVTTAGSAGRRGRYWHCNRRGRAHRRSIAGSASIAWP